MTAADTPATAVAVLRKRAGQVEDVSPVAFAPVRPDFLRAVADLTEALIDTDDRNPPVFYCRCCSSGRFNYHDANCPLAALERLIAGEPSRIEGERDAE